MRDDATPGRRRYKTVIRRQRVSLSRAWVRRCVSLVLFSSLLGVNVHEHAEEGERERGGWAILQHDRGTIPVPNILRRFSREPS